MATHDDDFLAQLFVTNTHTPVLFFSSAGRVYKLKVYRLPLGTPQARGKAMINLFPQLIEDETITAVLPLPEDETTYDELSVVFATASGKVRRNALADFIFVPANGKIAMKLDEGDALIGVDVATEQADIMLAARRGKCVRFPIGGVRVFRSRSSEGVRGMDLAKGDRVISMSILDHVEVSIEERDAFLKADAARRRQNGEDEEPAPEVELDVDRMEELSTRQQMILSITINGFGKRSSAYEYRVTHRGGQGIINIETSARNGEVIAAFPVADQDQVMLVTDQGKVIRIPVDGIRIAGRNTQGVTLFNTEPGEHVVSVARLSASAEANGADEDGADEDEGLAEEGTPDEGGTPDEEGILDEDGGADEDGEEETANSGSVDQD
jgi:DNA gyrase subunit A